MRTLRNESGSIRHNGFGLSLLAGLLLTVGTTGCQSANPMAQRQINNRLENINNTVRTFAWREDQNRDNLTRAVQFIQKDMATDALALRDDLDKTKAYFERDAYRWKENQPRYQQKLYEIFRGKPEEIEKTAILFL